MFSVVSYTPQRLYGWLPISRVIGNEGLIKYGLGTLVVGWQHLRVLGYWNTYHLLVDDETP